MDALRQVADVLKNFVPQPTEPDAEPAADSSPRQDPVATNEPDLKPTTAMAVSPTSPAPTSPVPTVDSSGDEVPPAPPVGVRGRGAWLNGSFVLDRDAPPQPPVPQRPAPQPTVPQPTLPQPTAAATDPWALPAQLPPLPPLRPLLWQQAGSLPPPATPAPVAPQNVFFVPQNVFFVPQNFVFAQQNKMCTLCMKIEDQWHLASKQHKEKLEESRTLDALLGPVPPPKTRVLTPVSSKPLYLERVLAALSSAWSKAKRWWNAHFSSVCPV
jgi:hypothetical protein